MSRRTDDGGPRRTCVGCRTRRPQSELIRLHLDHQGRVAVDRTGPGRGAWLCRGSAVECLRAAVDRTALARAFHRNPDAESVSTLLDAWSGDR